MKLDAADFKRLTWPIVLFSACLSIGAGALGGAWYLQKKLATAHRAAQAAQTEVRGKLNRASEEEQELRDKIGRYLALRSQGLIGAEKRLDWIEAIGRVKTLRRIIHMEYEFQPQRPVDASILPSVAGGAGGGFTAMSSQMRMKLRILHEGDLLGFLDDLRAAVQATIQVRSCSIDRIDPNGGEVPAAQTNRAQLLAECTLEWISLQEQK